MDLSIFVIRHAYTPLFQRDINIASYSGVMILPVELLTEQGYDLQFGTNVLGHFYLTKLLLPALLSGAKSSSEGKVCILYAGTIAADAELNGKYLVPFAHLGEAAPTTDDPELGQQLWKWSEEQVANL
ncbi:hypothetical protein H0H87_008735 [Tephrocybe sp. NHM501043]|nr:hypothetical protein H0H87_008735 [Tephrocybe sp. NHM501043]